MSSNSDVINDIQRRIIDLREQISDACEAAGRRADSVKLLAVSKTFPVEAVQAAFRTGQRDFGENYLQEAVTKIDAMPAPDWHFIGAIQSNKTRIIAEKFDWVHSVSSFKVARRLSEQRTAAKAPIKILLQVNSSGEDSKSGVSPEDAQLLAEQCAGLQNLELKGLMTIPQAGASEPALMMMQALHEQVANALGQPGFSELSMGMTQDFPAAIQYGATWIRIGTGIFGPRLKRS